MKRASATGALLFTAVVACALFAAGCADSGDQTGPAPETSAAPDGDALGRAFEQHTNDLEVEGQGTVVRILADDTEGGRHQRFILRLASGQTLLVAHNIDAAPRIDDLRVGDAVAFRGVYEWGEEGGTIHWTHNDPESAHAPGWLRHEGRTYQ